MLTDQSACHKGALHGACCLVVHPDRFRDYPRIGAQPAVVPGGVAPALPETEQTVVADWRFADGNAGVPPGAERPCPE